MTGKLRSHILYGALGAAILFGLYNFTLGRKSSPLPSSQAQSQSARTPADTIGSAIAKINLQECEAKPWGRDPFERGSARAAARGSASSTASEAHTSLVQHVTWILSGIVYSSQSPLAYINQKAVRVGDIVDQARVIRIEKDKVVLEHNGTRFDIFVTKG